MALYLDVGPDDQVCIGDDMTIALDRKRGTRKARVWFYGTSPVRLMRAAKPKVLAPTASANPPRTDTGD